jgi:hemolysin activation/secretion protein
MSYLLTVLLLAFYSFLSPASAQSQSDINRAQREAEKIQRDEQERLRREIEQQRKSVRPPAEIEIPAPPTSKTPSGGPCIAVNSIAIESSPNLSDSARERLTAPYADKCLDKAAIETLMADITADYISRGFSTTRVYLPEQDLRSGVLRIQVVEGVVEDIMIDDPGNGRISTLTAFPGAIGNPFNLRDFEQGLDQINKLQSNNAKTDIQPGKQPGGSVIVVRNQPNKWLPLGFNASRDNQGATSTGRVQDSISVNFDGLAGLNELVTITELRTHAFSGPGHDSRAGTGMFSLPFGYNTITATASQSTYASEVHGTGNRFMSNGITRTGSLVYDRVLMRGQDFKLSGSTGITRKNTRSWIAGNFMGVSSRKLSVWDADLTGTTGVAGGTVNGDLGYSRGLHAFGAKADIESIDNATPHAQFNKLRYSLGWQRPFEVYERKANFSTQLTGQYGLETLYGSEQISIGGLSSVRGFLDTSWGGDRGWYWRNDLSLTESWEVGGVTIALKPHVGYDIGKIAYHNGIQGATLAGIGYGASLTVGIFTLDIQRVTSAVHTVRLTHESPFTFIKLSTGL